jgi:hypothetical protein
MGCEIMQSVWLYKRCVSIHSLHLQGRRRVWYRVAKASRHHTATMFSKMLDEDAIAPRRWELSTRKYGVMFDMSGVLNVMTISWN